MTVRLAASRRWRPDATIARVAINIGGMRAIDAGRTVTIKRFRFSAE